MNNKNQNSSKLWRIIFSSIYILVSIGLIIAGIILVVKVENTTYYYLIMTFIGALLLVGFITNFYYKDHTKSKKISLKKIRPKAQERDDDIVIQKAKRKRQIIGIKREVDDSESLDS